LIRLSSDSSIATVGRQPNSPPYLAPKLLDLSGAPDLN
jgi:hypothetical protein